MLEYKLYLVCSVAILKICNNIRLIVCNNNLYITCKLQQTIGHSVTNLGKKSWLIVRKIFVCY